MEKMLNSKKKGFFNYKNVGFFKYISPLSIVIFSLAFFLINNSFLSAYNLKNIMIDSSPLLVMACGETLIILLGSIDLSVGAVCSVANVLFVLLIPQFGFWAYPITILFGLLSGLLLGLIQVKIKIPSFIASLGFMSIWSSAALLICDTPLSIAKKFRGVIDWAGFTIEPVNILFVIALVFVFIFYVIQVRTATGKGIFAIGGNERTARIAGVAVDKIKIMAFMLGGMCSALGGIILAAKLKSAAPTIGNSFTILVIASVALGGTALEGGRGKVLGTLLGAVLVTIIQNGMNIIGINAFWQQITFGIIVIGAVMMTVDRTRRNLIVK